MYTVAASGLLSMLDMLKASGLQTGALCDEIGLDRGAIEAGECRLPRTAVIRLIEQAALWADDPDLGLKLCERIELGSFQTVGYAMMSSADLYSALQRLVRFAPLLDDGTTLALTEEDAGIRLAGWPRHGEQAGRPYGDAMMAAVLGVCRRLLGGKPPLLLEARFMYPRPADTATHEAIFPCPLRFGAASYSILIARPDARRPLASADPVLERLHLNLAEERLARLAESALIRRVRTQILQRLSHAPPRLDEVAVALGVSKRALQRALELQGTRFKDLVDEVRRREAQEYLRHSRVELQEVSYLLGFREQSSFHRACTRWFGTTPGRYRSTGPAEAADGGRQAPARAAAVAETGAGWGLAAAW